MTTSRWVPSRGCDLSGGSGNTFYFKYLQSGSHDFARERGFGELERSRPQAKGSSAPSAARTGERGQQQPVGHCAQVGPVVAVPSRCGLTAGTWFTRESEDEVRGVPGRGSAGSSRFLPSGAPWGHEVAREGRAQETGRSVVARVCRGSKARSSPKSQFHPRRGEPLYYFKIIFISPHPRICLLIF